MNHIIKLNETALICRQDENGNYWPRRCAVNARALGIELDPDGSVPPKAIFGSAIVGPDGDEQSAREDSISYYTVKAGASIELVRVELEPHEIAENVVRWRDSQRRKTVREQRRAFIRAFNAIPLTIN